MVKTLHIKCVWLSSSTSFFKSFSCPHIFEAPSYPWALSLDMVKLWVETTLSKDRLREADLVSTTCSTQISLSKVCMPVVIRKPHNHIHFLLDWFIMGLVNKWQLSIPCSFIVNSIVFSAQACTNCLWVSWQVIRWLRGALSWITSVASLHLEHIPV